jgi:hypothetical protein
VLFVADTGDYFDGDYSGCCFGIDFYIYPMSVTLS